ncbi:MAG: peptidyl-prolyl cis-trans isomerase [Rickettsiales bacterium]|jgi:parvulin-like peptidyl-prolyl isomerase|nr:peptidyl-prolyl cis-trans isomerase [Rickettsiales bacterium]
MGFKGISKKKAICIMSFLLVLLFVGIFLTKDEPNLVALVDGHKIYKKDIQKTLDNLVDPEGEKATLDRLPPNIRNSIYLESYLYDKLDRIARRKGYYKNRNVIKSTKDYQKEIIRELFLNDRITKVTDEDINMEYEKAVAELQGQEERKIRHILVDDEDAAIRIKKSLNRGNKWERELEKSVDEGSKQSGGNIGYVLRSEVVPEFADVAFLLKVDEISKPVQTQYGWHIIVVDDIREAKIAPFDEVKEDIRQSLKQDAIKKYLEALTKDVEVKEININ